MRNFVTCLEFLTRIRFSNREEWKNDDFSKSVPYFPLVGLVIGLFLALVNFILVYLNVAIPLKVSILFLAEIIITGGLMYDGFMDTADGIFSARTRERMLEIMKDSCVGANAVLAMIILSMLKVSSFAEISGNTLSFVLIAMSVATRTFMVVYIVNFKYARKTGIGHMFKEYSKPSYTYIAFFICFLIMYLLGLKYILISIVTFAISLLIAKYISSQLNGLTGDTYGALTEIGNVVFLLTTIFLLDRW